MRVFLLAAVAINVLSAAAKPYIESEAHTALAERDVEAVPTEEDSLAKRELDAALFEAVVTAFIDRRDPEPEPVPEPEAFPEPAPEALAAAKSSSSSRNNNINCTCPALARQAYARFASWPLAQAYCRAVADGTCNSNPRYRAFSRSMPGDSRQFCCCITSGRSGTKTMTETGTSNGGTESGTGKNGGAPSNGGGLTGSNGGTGTGSGTDTGSGSGDNNPPRNTTGGATRVIPPRNTTDGTTPSLPQRNTTDGTTPSLPTRPSNDQTGAGNNTGGDTPPIGGSPAGSGNNGIPEGSRVRSLAKRAWYAYQDWVHDRSNSKGEPVDIPRTDVQERRRMGGSVLVRQPRAMAITITSAEGATVHMEIPEGGEVE